MKRTQKKPDLIIEDRKQASLWAAEILAQDNWVILDTNTTGLKNAEICQIAILRCDGYPLLNTLVKPFRAIPEEVTKIHGITDLMVSNAPCFQDVWWAIIWLTQAGKKVIIYNAEFDTQILDYCCQLYYKGPLRMNTICAMRWYSQWIGEWNHYHQNYKYQPLPGGTHNPLSNCQAVLSLIRKMAVPQLQPQEGDAVLGGNKTLQLPETGSLVLGGIHGVKKRLESADVNARVAALREAVKYGEAGLELVKKALMNENDPALKIEAYLILIRAC